MTNVFALTRVLFWYSFLELLRERWNLSSFEYIHYSLFLPDCFILDLVIPYIANNLSNEYIINPLCAIISQRKHKHAVTLHVIHSHWRDAGSCKFSSSKTRSYPWYRVYWTELFRSPARQGLIHIKQNMNSFAHGNGCLTYLMIKNVFTCVKMLSKCCRNHLEETFIITLFSIVPSNILYL